MDHKQSAFSQFKSQDKTKRKAKDGGQNINVPSRPKCYGCQGFWHMKQECSTYLKSDRKSKALAATLSDTEPKAKFDDSDQEGIVSAFTATINSLEEAVESADEEEELMGSKFEKMDEQDDIYTAYSKLYKVSEKHEKLYILATKKRTEVELEWEELSTKVDEANLTIRVLQFKNNFLVERTKKLDAELFQVKAQLKRASSAKLDKMLNFQKPASDKTSLGYDHSISSHNTSTGTHNKVIFIPSANNDYYEDNEPKTKSASESENDKGNSILRATPKTVKKETKQNGHCSTSKKS